MVESRDIKNNNGDGGDDDEIREAMDKMDMKDEDEFDAEQMDEDIR